MIRLSSLGIALALSLAPVRQNADGSVTYTPLPRDLEWLHVIENNDEGRLSSRLDLNRDGTGDMMFASDYTGVAVYTATNIRLVTGRWGAVGNLEGAGLEELGTSFVPPIGLRWTTPYVYRPGFYPPEYNLLPAKTSVALGAFAGVLPQSNFPYGGGYMGFELTEPDGVHYGWLRVENDGSDGMEYYVFGRITGFAYETEPGLPIRVGEIPEPNSCVLALLGAVAALRLSWRS